MSENTDELTRLKRIANEHLASQSPDYQLGFEHGLIFMRRLDNEMQKQDIAGIDKTLDELNRLANATPE